MMATQKLTICGKIDINIDKQGLKATISFTRGKDGDPLWDLKSLKELLEKKGIKEGFSEQSLRIVLRKLAESKDHVISLTVAEGIYPEKPVPETVEWEKLSLPDDIKKDAEKILAMSEPPEIYKEYFEKKTIEKEIEKKGALPFLPAKKEKQKVTEKIAKREKIYIDPTVLQVFFVEKGTYLGRVLAPVSGLEGRNIFGEVIPPLVLEDTGFYAGNGVKREKTDLKAEETGILRIGKNWVDIIPFRPHIWEVSLSQDKATCLLSLIPGSELAQFPSVEKIIEKANELEFPQERLLPQEEIQEIIRFALSKGEELKNVPISGDSDAFFKINISKDRLLATLTLHKGTGRGRSLNLKEVGRAIKESGLKGLDYKKINQDILDFYNSKEVELRDYVLAKGKAPKKGSPRSLEPSVRYLPAEEIRKIIESVKNTPEAYKGINSITEFSINEVEKMAIVEEEQPIFLISPAMPGEPGIDVFGEKIEGLPGDAPPLKTLENIEEKGNLLISSIHGILEEGEKEGVLYLRVRPHSDGKIIIETSPDDMEAYISLEEGTGTGRKLSLEDIKKALKEEGIIKGIDEEAIKNALDEAKQNGKTGRILIAKGKEPVAGGEKKLEFMVSLASGKKYRETEDGRINFKEHDTQTRIENGQTIAKILPPAVKEEEGWDIRGRVRKPIKTEKPFELEIGEGIKEEKQQDGSVLLIAETDGILFYNKKKIAVLVSRVIKGDIDISTGNLKFTGDIKITGSVRTGFYVMTTGSISVGEGVEAALLSAGSNIVIKQGIKGARKGTLRAKGSISARFAEYAHLLAVENIILSNFCMGSLVKSNGKLVVGPEKGKILGGKIKARMGIETGDLGSANGIRTEIFFGQDYLIEDQIEVEEGEIAKLKQKIVKLDAEMERLSRNGHSNKVKELHSVKFKMLKMMEKRSYRLFTLREKFEQHFDSEIIVYGTIYPGVVIETHGRIHEIRKPQKNVKVKFDSRSGRIELEPLKK
ncbi:flagellar assembly protein A [Spirochaetia bacterium 38H-sp]|uniref:Flagellar assembly protein A n=1 Tax=Rarispira pelagica TaxID=3141764 RepID=A0ABU9U9A4_9SPIR